MAEIFNYESGETLATGFVRPKVTSLFFDKIYIPNSLLDTYFEYSAIPDEVLVRESEELRIKKKISIPVENAYKTAKLDNSDKMIELVLQMGQSFQMDRNSNLDSCYDTIADILATGVDKEVTKLSASPLQVLASLDSTDSTKPENFKYSKNRNHAILSCSENFCRQYGIHISPVYHDLTEFEREAQSLENNQLYNHESLLYRLKEPDMLKNENAFSICIQDFPSINEDALSWEHVMDIRKDKKRMRQLQCFTKWTNSKLKDKSPDEIREILESELDEYRAAIKELGIKASIGSFSTLISELNPMVSLFSNPQSIMPWISMVAIPLPFITDIYLANMKNRKNPIAYLYDIQNKD